MKHEEILLSIRQRYCNINNFAEIFLDGFEQGGVEGFMQEVDRLRALACLIGDKGDSGFPDRLLAFYQKMGILRDLQLLRGGLITYAKQKEVRVPDACLAVIDGLLSMASRLVAIDFELAPPDLREPGSRPALHRANLSNLSKAFVRERMKVISFGGAAEDLTDGLLREREEAMKDLLYVWLFIDRKAVGLIRPASLGDRQVIFAQRSLLSAYRDAVSKMDMLQDPNFLFATGQGAKPFLQAVLQEWLREKQELRAAISGALVAGEEGPTVRRRRARPVVRSIADCNVQ
jgi:hypothetical protein